MSSDRDARASALFLALSAVPAAARDAWLAEQCGADLDLRRRVESLIAALDAPTGFLDPAALHPPVVDAETLLTPGTRLGDFTIQRVIGSGSAGIVYSAQQTRPRRTVALKVLRGGLAASSARRRFEVEAELLGQLHHPGIAQIFAAHPGDETTPPFIALELVDGLPVTEFARAAELDVRARVELMARICDAVQHAHQRGVIHRDLKPANVLVARDGQPKVVDFGVARISGASVAITTINTEVGQLIGTVPYMSPEQLNAVPEEIDTRSDVYALGVILFRLLTGHLPFAEDEPALPELARRIAQDEPPRLSRTDAAFDADLDAIVGCALAKEKARRYPSAADLAADLRRWLSGQPVVASVDSAWYVVRKRLMRYRRALAASAAAVVALVILSAYAELQRSRAEQTSAELAEELSASNVERARLLGRTGNLRGAEELLWDELFRRPDSRHVRWALWEAYSRESTIWTRIVDPGGTELIKFDREGRRLFTAGRDGHVRVLDPLTGDVQQVLEGHDGPVTLLALSPGGNLVTGAPDGIRVWQDDGTRAFVPSADGANLTSLATVGDEIVAAAAGDDRVRFWSTRDGSLAGTFVVPHETITVIAVAPGQDLLAAGTADGGVTLWEHRTRRVRWHRQVHETHVTALAFSPRSGVLMSGSTDQRLAMLDAQSGDVLQRIEASNGTVRSLAFDALGRRLAVAGWWRAQLWDMEGVRLEEGGASQGVWRADLSPDGRLLATCDGADGPVRMWDLGADPRVARSRPHEGRVVGLAVDGPEPILVSAGSDGTVRAQLADTHLPRFSGSEHTRVRGLGLSERHAIVLSADGRLAAWDVSSGKRVAEVVAAHASTGLPAVAATEVSALAVSRVDGHVAVGDDAGRLGAWHWDGERFVQGYDVLSEDGEILHATMHGGYLALAHRGGRVVVRARADGRLISHVTPASTPFAVSFSADGRWLAVGTWTGIVELWDAARWRRRFSLTGHSRLISGLDFSDDGTLLVSASRDGTVRLWDVGTGRALATIASRLAGASRVRFLSPDRLAIAYDDGEIETRDLEYFFRHVAGQAEHQRQMLEHGRGDSYIRGDEALAWSRQILATRMAWAESANQSRGLTP